MPPRAARPAVQFLGPPAQLGIARLRVLAAPCRLRQFVAQREPGLRARALLAAMLANAPLALALTVEAVNAGYDLPLDEALRFEASAFGLAAATDDMREGTRAFLGKRAARFQGR